MTSKPQPDATIHNHMRLTTCMDFPGCPKPLNKTRVLDEELHRVKPCVEAGGDDGDDQDNSGMFKPLNETRVMDEEPHHVKLRVEAGGDDGGDGDNNGLFTMATHGHGVVSRLDPARIVDGVLADLPEPAQHHIFPEIEDYYCAWPAPCPAI